MNINDIAKRVVTFMNVNKRFSFSKEELKFVVQELTKNQKVSESNVCPKRLSITLEEMGHPKVYKRGSKAERHKYWLHSGINSETLKLNCKI